MRLHDIVKPVLAIAPGTAPTDNTAVVSAILDTANFTDAELVILTGTLVDADATFAIQIDHGNTANLSDAAAVDDDELIGTEAEAGFTFAADGATRKIGYRGVKRYLRATITPTGNASAAPMAAVWLLGGGRVQPV